MANGIQSRVNVSTKTSPVLQVGSESDAPTQKTIAVARPQRSTTDSRGAQRALRPTVAAQGCSHTHLAQIGRATPSSKLRPAEARTMAGEHGVRPRLSPRLDLFLPRALRSQNRRSPRQEILGHMSRAANPSTIRRSRPLPLRHRELRPGEGGNLPGPARSTTLHHRSTAFERTVRLCPKAAEPWLVDLA